MSLASRNTYVIDPWSVELIDAEWRTPAATDVDYADYLPRRSLAMLKLAGLGARVRDMLRGGKKRMSTGRYTPISQLEGRIKGMAERLGFNIAEISPDEMIDVVVAAANDAGLLPPSLAPGVRYVAEASFNVAHIAVDIELAYEDLGEPVEITLNGTRVAAPRTSTYIWDACNLVVPVRSRLVLGRNRIRVESRVPGFPDKMPSYHGLEPVVLCGTFAVRHDTIGKLNPKVTTGDWRDVGFPHYSGEIVYGQRFDLPAFYLSKRLRIEVSDVREVVEVWLNGQRVGDRIVAPFALDITEAALEGRNDLELRISNTAENLLGIPVASGLIGSVAIVPYNPCAVTVALS